MRIQKVLEIQTVSEGFVPGVDQVAGPDESGPASGVTCPGQSNCPDYFDARPLSRIPAFRGIRPSIA